MATDAYSEQMKNADFSAMDEGGFVQVWSPWEVVWEEARCVMRPTGQAC